MVSLTPADPLGVAQDGRRDLLGGCGGAWHGILNPVRRDGQVTITFFHFFPDFGSYMQSWLSMAENFPWISSTLCQGSVQSDD